MERVYATDIVELSRVQGTREALIIAAQGRATSTGWSNPVLVKRTHVAMPNDRVQEVEFLATPPASGLITLPVLTPTFADLALTGIDIPNYWGPSQALAGVRVLARENAKLAWIETVRHMPEPRHFAVTEVDGTTPPPPMDSPSFETDIKPRFRPRDRHCMLGFGGFDLHNHDDVIAWADRILVRLEDGTMPDDGAWPASDVDLFRQWIDSGMAP